MVSGRSRVFAFALAASSGPTAEVSYIAPAIDPQRGSIEVRVRVPEPPGFLKPDMTVSVDLTVASKTRVLTVASDAVRGAAASTTVPKSSSPQTRHSLGSAAKDAPRSSQATRPTISPADSNSASRLRGRTALATGVGLIAAVIPARRAARLDPATAIRGG